MTLLALTGGIASGKSTIAARLVEHGAIHVDADALAREAVAPGSRGLTQIVNEFGAEMLNADGSLRRAQLAGVVFSDPIALQRLNAIVHPEVRLLADARIAEGLASSDDAVVVYDVPLLVESGVKGDWDLVVVAEAPEAVRIDRLVRLRGMGFQEATQRVTAQASNEDRHAIADIVIDTSGSLQMTLEQVDALWNRLSQWEEG